MQGRRREDRLPRFYVQVDHRKRVTAYPREHQMRRVSIARRLFSAKVQGAIGMLTRAALHVDDTVGTLANDSGLRPFMGVISRKSGDNFIITSDQIVGEAPSKHAPKKHLSDVFQVWTGSGWSPVTEAAAIFPELDAADEYIRANFERVMR